MAALALCQVECQPRGEGARAGGQAPPGETFFALALNRRTGDTSEAWC